MTERDVIIVGSGPAGLTAALYTARANLKPVVISGVEAGGQLMLTTEVENFPGFEDGIMGPDLMGRMRKQAERFGAEFVSDNATTVDFSKTPFSVGVGGQEYAGNTVVITTGASAKMLGSPGEREHLGHGVSTCATCDGFFFQDEQILVVGGGDSAMEEATFLTRFAEKVTLVHRRDSFRASRIMQDRVTANPKIEILWDTVVAEIYGDGKVAGARLENVSTGEEFEKPVGGVFVAIGHTPNTTLFEGQLELDGGYIRTFDGTSRTSVPGVFAAGDVVDYRYRQAITAAGMGCMAAMDAERFLEASFAFRPSESLRSARAASSCEA